MKNLPLSQSLQRDGLELVYFLQRNRKLQQVLEGGKYIVPEMRCNLDEFLVCLVAITIVAYPAPSFAICLLAASE